MVAWWGWWGRALSPASTTRRWGPPPIWGLCRVTDNGNCRYDCTFFPLYITSWEDSKKFRSEYYLDLHMERHHMDETQNRSFCPADYCYLFPGVCTAHRSMDGGTNGDGGNSHEPLGAAARAGAGGSDDQDPSFCDESRHMILKEECEKLFLACFPLTSSSKTESSSVVRELSVRFRREFCARLDCRIQQRLEPTGGMLERQENSSFLAWIHGSTVLTALFSVLFVVLGLASLFCCLDASDSLLVWIGGAKWLSREQKREMLRVQNAVGGVVGRERTKQL